MSIWACHLDAQVRKPVMGSVEYNIMTINP